MGRHTGQPGRKTHPSQHEDAQDHGAGTDDPRIAIGTAEGKYASFIK